MRLWTSQESRFSTKLKEEFALPIHKVGVGDWRDPGVDTAPETCQYAQAKGKPWPHTTRVPSCRPSGGVGQVGVQALPVRAGPASRVGDCSPQAHPGVCSVRGSGSHGPGPAGLPRSQRLASLFGPLSLSSGVRGCARRLRSV